MMDVSRKSVVEANLRSLVDKQYQKGWERVFKNKKRGNFKRKNRMEKADS